MSRRVYNVYFRFPRLFRIPEYIYANRDCFFYISALLVACIVTGPSISLYERWRDGLCTDLHSDPYQILPCGFSASRYSHSGPCVLGDSRCFSKLALRYVNEFRVSEGKKRVKQGTENQFEDALNYSIFRRNNRFMVRQSMNRGSRELRCKSRRVAEQHALGSGRHAVGTLIWPENFHFFGLLGGTYDGTRTFSFEMNIDNRDPARLCVDAWISSPTDHRRKLLGDYESVSLGAVFGPKNTIWCTQTFVVRTKYKGSGECASLRSAVEDEGSSYTEVLYEFFVWWFSKQFMIYCYLILAIGFFIILIGVHITFPNFIFWTLLPKVQQNLMAMMEGTFTFDPSVVSRMFRRNPPRNNRAHFVQVRTTTINQQRNSPTPPPPPPPPPLPTEHLNTSTTNATPPTNGEACNTLHLTQGKDAPSIGERGGNGNRNGKQGSSELGSSHSNNVQEGSIDSTIAQVGSSNSDNGQEGSIDSNISQEGSITSDDVQGGSSDSDDGQSNRQGGTYDNNNRHRGSNKDPSRRVSFNLPAGGHRRK